MSKKKDIGRHYEPRLRALRESYEILDWASPVTQEARFAVLADNVDLPGKSLLDVGCGLGDLWAYLRRRRVEVEYLGVDILEKMVAAARQRHPEARFEQADIFGADTYEPAAFDVVFCSGAFNLNLGNNLEFLPQAIARMCRLARQYVVFNLLHVRAASEQQKYFYHDPVKVRALLTSPACQVRIIDDYLPNDFTVICRKASPESRCPWEGGGK